MIEVLKTILEEFGLIQYLSFDNPIEGKICVVKNNDQDRYDIFCMTGDKRFEIMKNQTEEELCLDIIKRFSNSNESFLEARNYFYQKMGTLIDLNEYYETISKIRKDFYERVSEYMNGYVISDSDIDSSHNQIFGNGAIGIEFYYFMPWYLYTPLGRICLFERIGNIEDISKCNECVKRLKEEYGIVSMGYKIHGGGHYCTEQRQFYSITKLPWEEEKLPLLVEKKDEDYITFTTENAVTFKLGK